METLLRTPRRLQRVHGRVPEPIRHVSTEGQRLPPRMQRAYTANAEPERSWPTEALQVLALAYRKRWPLNWH